MSWIANLPVGILYAIVGLCGLIIVGFLGIVLFTLAKGGRVKAGAVELDTEPEKQEDTDVKP
jgi:hypothetical protein